MITTKDNNTTPVLELRRLLYALKDSGSTVGLRVRLIGELWQPFHKQIFQVTEKGVLLKELSTGKISFINDLSQIMQFELDESFQQYKPNFHYTVGTISPS